MIEVLVLFLTFILLTFLGYGFHWMFHQPWSKRFYVAHMNHHTKQYPPTDFYSDKYRDPGKDNTVWAFLLVFSPIILIVLFATIFNIIPTIIGLSIIIEMAIIGWLNNSLHDSFHLRKTFWHRFKFFDRLTKLHYQHHIDMRMNYGIFNFTFDRIFRTYRQ